MWGGYSLLSQTKSLNSHDACGQARVQLGAQLSAQTAEPRGAPQAGVRRMSRMESKALVGNGLIDGSLRVGCVRQRQPLECGGERSSSLFFF